LARELVNLLKCHVFLALIFISAASLIFLNAHENLFAVLRGSCLANNSYLENRYLSSLPALSCRLSFLTAVIVANGDIV
jgi:hypothetical protein